MATRIVTRAIQQTSQAPCRLLPFLHKQQQQSFSEPCSLRDTEEAQHIPSSQLAFSPFLNEISQQPWIPSSGLGFPPHTDAGRRHESFFFFFNKVSPQSALSDEPLQTKIQKLWLNSPHVPSQTRLPLQDSAYLAPEMLWMFTNTNYFPPSSEMDEVILPSHSEDATSPMLMSTKRTFNPSTIVRKRRHGFLARKATVGGRRILARRFLKGRRRLSA
eukprot:c22175_g1_i1 orf=446-1096(-)